jgi:hypothetical protein
LGAFLKILKMSVDLIEVGADSVVGVEPGVFHAGVERLEFFVCVVGIVGDFEQTVDNVLCVLELLLEAAPIIAVDGVEPDNGDGFEGLVETTAEVRICLFLPLDPPKAHC